MSKWKMARLGDVLTVEKVTVLPENTTSALYVGLEHIAKNSGEIVSTRTLVDGEIKSAKLAFDNRHILYGKLRPNLNKVALPDFSGVCSTDIYPLLINEAIADKYYISSVLRHKNFVSYASIHAHGANLPRVDEKIITAYRIPLPPLDVQRKIAVTLDTVAEIIRLRKKQLTELDLLVKSRFIEMFGNPVTNDMGWPVRRLDQIATTRLGKMLDAKQQTGDYQYKYLANFNVQWFRFDFSKLNTMDFDEADRAEFALEAGDLLVCEGGEVGRTAIWKEERENCFFQKALHRIRCNSEICVPEYIAWSMYFKAYTTNFDGIASSATIAHLPGVKLKTLMFQTPPLDLQIRFASFAAQADKSKFVIQQAIDETRMLFGSLMSEY
ncbi:MAG: restriction endonuclease subunit S, partial [Synergistaceae bacterium]|nr:restriction endonuclease subunit S [Synergistaceae bacterium]